MKANEFVLEHGFQYTRNLVRDYPNHTHTTDDGRMFINENTCAEHIKVQLNELVKMDDLKRLIESYDYIKSLGGISFVKDNLPLGYFGDGNYEELIQKCLEDVESCL